jgi:hypothetical protein
MTRAVLIMLISWKDDTGKYLLHNDNIYILFILKIGQTIILPLTLLKGLKTKGLLFSKPSTFSQGLKIHHFGFFDIYVYKNLTYSLFCMKFKSYYEFLEKVKYITSVIWFKLQDSNIEDCSSSVNQTLSLIKE